MGDSNLAVVIVSGESGLQGFTRQHGQTHTPKKKDNEILNSKRLFLPKKCSCVKLLAFKRNIFLKNKVKSL